MNGISFMKILAKFTTATRVAGAIRRHVLVQIAAASGLVRKRAGELRCIQATRVAPDSRPRFTFARHPGTRAGFSWPSKGERSRSSTSFGNGECDTVLWILAPKPGRARGLEFSG
jgi:hypothetical protein